MNTGSTLQRKPFANRGTGFKVKAAPGQFSSFTKKTAPNACKTSASSYQNDSFKARPAVDSAAAEDRRRAEVLAARESRQLPAPVQPRGSYAKVDSQKCNAARAKEPRQKNPRLLALAKGEDCALLSPFNGAHDSQTVVAAHANWAAYGKAKGQKAHDFFSVTACHTCHTWLDQESGDQDLKKSTFEAAMVRQIKSWREMVARPGLKPSKRQAAQWALDGLAAHPLGRVFLSQADAMQ